ncbi:MAG: [Fe-Fe] hydrogenase large subunit C-terminal domain-containing protein [Oscillospiraceae bacterium]
MFTSCCPGWVRFVEDPVPRACQTICPPPRVPSRCSVPWPRASLHQEAGVDPDDIFVVSIMPCVAKRAEAELPTMRDACGGPDVDVVLTTREIVRMFRAEQLDPAVPMRRP